MEDRQEAPNADSEEQVEISREGKGLLQGGVNDGKLAEALLLVLERQDDIERRIKEVYAGVLRIEQKIDELIKMKDKGASPELENRESVGEGEPPLTQPSPKRKYDLHPRLF